MKRSYLNCYTLGRSVPSMERLDFVLPCGRGQALSLLALYLDIKQILMVRRRLLPFKIPDTMLYVSRVSNNDMATFLWRTGYLKLSSNPLLRQMERWLYEYQLFRHIRRQEQTVDEVVIELFHPSQEQHPLLALADPEHPPNDVLLARLQFMELSAEQTLLRIFIGWADLAPLAELDTLYNLLRGYIHLMTRVLLPDADDGALVGKAELTTEAVTAETAVTANAALAQATPVDHVDGDLLFARSAEHPLSEPTADSQLADPAPDPARLDLPKEGKDAAGEECVEEIGSERPFPDEGESNPRSTAAVDAPYEQQRGWPTDGPGEIDWLHSGNGFLKTDVPVESVLADETDETAEEGIQESAERPLAHKPQTVSTPGDDNDALYRYIDPPRFYPKTLSNICIMVAERQRQIDKMGVIPGMETFNRRLRPSRNTLLKIPELVAHWFDVNYCWNVETWLRRYSGHTEMEISEMLSYLYVKLDYKVWAAVTSAGKEEE